MNYQISNEGGNIKFYCGGKEFSLEKKAVKQIAVIREDIIKLSTSNCLGDIFIRQQNVTEPVTTDATDLIVWLNYIMTVYEETPPMR